MNIRNIIKLLLVSFGFSILLHTQSGCKAKKCANFENPDSLKKMKYGKDGRVKKKGAKPSWDNR